MVGVQEDRRRRASARERALVAVLAEGTSFRPVRQLHGALRRRGLTISLSTVYRRLAVLLQDGQVDLVYGANGKLGTGCIGRAGASTI
ncbi:MAG: hypothetical protein GEU98_04660 [Pseudonocardiaceae bacterium]|nr:hypothetical protein [Pseudonocardiaceae bacterium]